MAAIVLFKNPQGLLHYGEVTMYAVNYRVHRAVLRSSEPDRLMGGDRTGEVAVPPP